MRLIAPCSGTYYQIEALEARRYARFFDHVTAPEALAGVLTPGDCLFVPCRTPDHPLMRDIGKPEITWHLHGHFDPPEGTKVLATDSEGARNPLSGRGQHTGQDGRHLARPDLSPWQPFHAGDNAAP